MSSLGAGVVSGDGEGVEAVEAVGAWGVDVEDGEVVGFLAAAGVVGASSVL